MALQPAPPKPAIYHITHVRNLAQILASGVLWSDAQRVAQGLTCEVVGMREVKRRRLEELEVKCHRGTKVGEFVPFYFCPRSIMLYILHMGNHPSIDYTEGQRPIVHLVADYLAVTHWAEEQGRLWAFSDRNAGARFAEFYESHADLGRINWEAVAARDFRKEVIREGKQAEFLLHDSFPWTLIERIGVIDEATGDTVRAILATAEHRPAVVAEPDWYY